MGAKVRALELLKQAWTVKVHSMTQMNQGTSVKPFDPQDVIHVEQSASADGVDVRCGPAVFRLCERAGGIPRMYVVVEGWITVQVDGGRNAKLQTTNFGTTVGYFRSKKNRLEHVYGVHYDMDDQGKGHPVFHSQMRPAKDLADEIRSRYQVDGEVVDYAKCMLRNVRVPTAQMDFFSVFTQLCADHLISNRASNTHPEVISAFCSLRSACNMLQGVAHRLSYLSCEKASDCYRSSHWYGDSSEIG